LLPAKKTQSNYQGETNEKRVKLKILELADDINKMLRPQYAKKNSTLFISETDRFKLWIT